MCCSKEQSWQSYAAKISGRPSSLFGCRPKRAAQIGGFGLTRCYELINDGQLKTTKVGGMRLVSVASIKALGVIE